MTEIQPMQTATNAHLDEASSTPLMTQNADYQAIEYRLNNRKHMSDIGTNQTRTFAVELNNGAIIRVNVSAEQAEQFEQELSAAISSNPDADVGNLIYELTRFFDIYDVQWQGEFDDQPPVQEADATPPVDAGGEDAGFGDGDALLDPTDPDAGAAPDAGLGGVDGPDEDEVRDDASQFDLNNPPEDDGLDPEAPVEQTTLTQLLQTIVTQLATDADARKAEAEAKKAQADAEKAKAVAAAMEIRVGQETEKAEMEEWEDGQKAKDKKTKEMDRLAKFRLAKAQGLGDSKIDQRAPINEDWGSSDMSAAIKSMVRDLFSMGVEPTGVGITRGKLHAAAMSAAEFYHEHMGYPDPSDAAARLEQAFSLRVRHQGLDKVMCLEGFAVSPQMRQEITRLGKAIRGKPTTDQRAFDTVKDAALDLSTNPRAVRQQAEKDISNARQSGADQRELSQMRKAANLESSFAKKMAALRQQLQVQLQNLKKV
jgi:hypothetical protein